MRHVERRRAVLARHRRAAPRARRRSSRRDNTSPGTNSSRRKYERSSPSAVGHRPQLVLAVDLADADRARLMPRLQEPGRRHAPAELAHALVVEHVDERRHRQPIVLRLDAHRQLVAKVPRRRLAHARHAQVLAQRRGLFEIEVVERDDAVDRRRGARDATRRG